MKNIDIIIGKISIFLLFVAIFSLAVSFVSFKLDNLNMRTLNVQKYNISIALEDVYNHCNNSGDLEIIRCLNKVYSDNIVYDGCVNRSFTYSPEQALNLGKGCCRESTDYYSYFLDEYNISYQIVDFPTHIFVIAYLQDEDDRLTRYIVLDCT